MGYPKSAQIKGGKNRATHGAYAIEERGEAAMTPEQRQTFTEIKASLGAPEGIVEALRERVAMGLVVVGVIERYAEEQNIAGKTPDDIPILKAWPAFQNSVVRALKQLMDTMPPAERDSYQEALQRINAAIDEHAEKDVQRGNEQASDDLQSPGTQQEAIRNVHHAEESDDD